MIEELVTKQLISNELEIWKDIKGFEGTYQVSNLGRIKSLERFINNGKGQMMLPEKILKPSIQKEAIDGRVVLRKAPEKEVRYLVKDLVASHFLEFTLDEPYTMEFYTVYQKDKNPENTRADNLYYAFNRHATRVYDYEGYWLGDYPTAVKASEITGVLQSSIIDIMNGTMLSTHGFQFRRLSKDQSIFKLPSLYLDSRGNTIPVAKYWNGRLVCVYNSMLEAANKNSIEDARMIQNSIERGVKVKGATFKKIS